MERTSRSLRNRIVDVLKEFGAGAWNHDLMTLSAALAFYTALSLAPLLLITLSVVGLLAQGTQEQLVTQIQSVIGPQAADAVRLVIANTDNRPQLGSIAGLFGVLVLLFTASGVFAQLQASLNIIWGASNSSTTGIFTWVVKRLMSMGLVLAIGFMAAVSLVINAVLSFVLGSDGQLWQWVNTGISLFVFTLLFSLIFAFLPDRRLPIKETLIGGFLTSLLFSFGKYFIGLYLGHSAVGSAYGAAGSLIVLLLWVYYSSLILFIGAELTRALHAFRHAAPAHSKQAQVQTPSGSLALEH